MLRLTWPAALLALLANCSPAPLPDDVARDAVADAPAPDSRDDVVAPDAAPDARDVAADAPFDAPFDVALDAAPDGPLDAPADGPLDAPADSALDAPADSALDAPADSPLTPDAPPPDIPTTCPPPDWDAAVLADASAPPTLTRDIQPIFDAHCSCHQTGALAPVLLPGFSYDQLVCAREAVPCPTALVRVIPGDPSHSGLYLRVSGAGCYEQMPLGMTPLSTDQIALIAAWIRAGAPR